ncbi:MAG: group II intron maturase-specific domain-containing protein [Rickettsia endosymbiont of Pentastiridius leporinus]
MTLEEIAYNINTVIIGWLQYYGEFRKYDLRHLFRVLNNRLVKWACSKYKPFRYNKSLAREWVKEKVITNPETLEHWKAGFIVI